MSPLTSEIRLLGELLLVTAVVVATVLLLLARAAPITTTSLLCAGMLVLGTAPLLAWRVQAAKSRARTTTPEDEAYLSLSRQMESEQLTMSDRRRAVISQATFAALDLSGKITKVNRSFCQLTGYDREELIGMNIRTLSSDELAFDVWKHVSNTIAGGRTWRGELCNKAKDGSRYWVDATIGPIRDRNGVLTGYIAIHLDITARKCAERKLLFTQFSLDHAADPILWVAPDATILYVNNAACSMLGFARDELMGGTVAEIDPNFTAAGWADHWNELKRRGSFTFESDHTTKDGRVVNTEVTANYVRHEEREVVCATLRDITDRNQARRAAEQAAAERAQAEAALQRSEAQLRAIFEADPDCIQIIDADCKLADVNPAGLAMIEGESIERVRGMCMLDLVLPEHREQYRSEVAQIFAGKEPCVRTYELVGLKGTRRWMEQHAAALRDTDGAGSVSRMLAVTRDITEQRTSRELLAQSERDYRGLFENAHDAILIVRPEDEVVLDVNQRACDMYGFSREEFIGMSLERLNQDVARGRRELEETLQHGLYLNFESVQYRKDGSAMPVEVNAAVTEYRGERAILSISRDVTWRKQAEAETVKTVRREALATLAGGIAHEFNSTLLAAATYLHDLHSQSPLPGTPVARATVLIQQAQSLSASLMELFAGPEVVTPPTLAVGKWLPHYAQHRTDFLPVGISVKLEPVNALLEASIDPLALEQVLRLLLSNAAEALAGQGEIRLSAARAPEGNGGTGNVEIRVSDQGPGVAPADRERLFEPFFTTRTRSRRSGLGLTIASRLVEQVGGRLYYEPNESQGSTFVVRLCLAPRLSV